MNSIRRHRRPRSNKRRRIESPERKFSTTRPIGLERSETPDDLARGARDLLKVCKEYQEAQDEVMERLDEIRMFQSLLERKTRMARTAIRDAADAMEVHEEDDDDESSPDPKGMDCDIHAKFKLHRDSATIIVSTKEDGIYYLEVRPEQGLYAYMTRERAPYLPIGELTCTMMGEPEPERKLFKNVKRSILAYNEDKVEEGDYSVYIHTYESTMGRKRPEWKGVAPEEFIRPGVFATTLFCTIDTDLYGI